MPPSPKSSEPKPGSSPTTAAAAVAETSAEPISDKVKSQVDPSNSTTTTRTTSSPASSLPPGPVSSYRYNFDYITKGASAFTAASQSSRPQFQRSQSEARISTSSTTDAHARTGTSASRPMPTRSKSNSALDVSSVARDVSPAADRGQRRLGPSSTTPTSIGAMKGNLGMMGSSYGFSYGFHTDDPAKSKASVPPSAAGKDQDKDARLSTARMHPTRSTSSLPVSLSDMLRKRGEEYDAERKHKHKRTPGSDSDTSDSVMSESDTNSLSSSEGESSPPSSSVSDRCVEDECATTDSIGMDEPEECAKKREEAALRALAYMQAEARREQEARRRLLAGVLLARSMSKARPLGRSSATSSSGSAAREVSVIGSAEDKSRVTRKGGYVRSGLSSLVVVEC